MKLNAVKSSVLVTFISMSTPAILLALGHTSMFGCDGCHTPHDAEVLPSVPLWNGRETTSKFVVYSSETFQGAADGQPSGNSKLCLACHDGSSSGYVWMDPEHSFGTNGLARSHPISFVYDSALAILDGALKDPSEASTLGRTIQEDLLDAESKIQCGSCHDVHSSGVGDNLLRGYDYESQSWSGLCRMCHIR